MCCVSSRFLCSVEFVRNCLACSLSLSIVTGQVLYGTYAVLLLALYVLTN